MKAINIPLLRTEAATSLRVMGIFFVCTACIFFIALSKKTILESIEKSNESIESELASQASEVKMLRLQINPHFLSNAHTKLNSLIRTNDIDKAINYNTKIATLFRDKLISTTKELVSLEVEFKWLKNYIEIEKDLFENLFEFSIETNNLPVSDFLFPPMFLQPLVENSIVHGFLPEWHKRIGFLKIELIEMSDYSYKIILKDDGVGFASKELASTSPHSSLSLKSINSRIALINMQNNIHLTMNSFSPITNNRGTEILLTVSEKSIRSHIR